jgi:hypothetical protein
MAEVEVTVVRSCNDDGGLYGSVTHRDIADALVEAGWAVDVRSVRITHSIRRIGVYPVPIQFDKDLRAEVTVTVKSDRELEGYTLTGEPVETEEPEASQEHEEDRDRPRRRRGDEFDEPKGRRERGERGGRRERGGRKERKKR